MLYDDDDGDEDGDDDYDDNDEDGDDDYDDNDEDGDDDYDNDDDVRINTCFRNSTSGIYNIFEIYIRSLLK